MLLNLPKDKPKTVKDVIMLTLTIEWPLSARKIYNQVRKKYGFAVTYQAVHKAIKELLNDEIILKEDKAYSLNKDWIEGIKNFAINLGKIYESKSTVTLEKIIEQDHGSFTFETVFDLYKFVLDTIVFFENYCPQPKYPGIVHYSHMWWSLIGSEKEQEKFKKAACWKKGVYFICAGNTYADKLLAKFYEGVKGANVKIKLGVNCANDCELFMIEDYLMQIYLPHKIKNVFDSTYRNFKTGNISTFRKFYENILFKKTEINVVMHRNPRLAELIRRNTLKYFKK